MTTHNSCNDNVSKFVHLPQTFQCSDRESLMHKFCFNFHMWCFVGASFVLQLCVCQLSQRSHQQTSLALQKLLCCTTIVTGLRWWQNPDKKMCENALLVGSNKTKTNELSSLKWPETKAKCDCVSKRNQCFIDKIWSIEGVFSSLSNLACLHNSWARSKSMPDPPWDSWHTPLTAWVDVARCETFCQSIASQCVYQSIEWLITGVKSKKGTRVGLQMGLCSDVL